MGDKSKALVFDKRYQQESVFTLEGIAMLAFGIALFAYLSSRFVVANAEGFTDIFYTNSFRGSFEWFKKMDLLGMVVQGVISVFSLVGVSLIVIRIMTSMLYLSAKGLWEEVHDLKQSGGESEMYDFGLINMAKTWAKGKAGTGLDAILGAVLVLLPDVKRYSDFGEKSGQKFDEDITISQYILKISLPTVLAVFFLAMGFNGTLVKGLAVTVDAMGTFADKAVSVNYSGFVEDLINTGTGYKFTYRADGSTEGKLKQSLATDIYGRVLSRARGASAAQLQAIGLKVEGWVNDNWDELVDNSNTISEELRTQLTNSDEAVRDRYYSSVGFEVYENTNKNQASSETTQPLAISEVMAADGVGLLTGEATRESYLHIFMKQTGNSVSAYFNVDDVGR